MKRICICGGGNLGHVVAGFLAANGCEVTLLTRHPERWSHTLLKEQPLKDIFPPSVPQPPMWYRRQICYFLPNQVLPSEVC